jgi:DNA-binding HxlR family transcriptional regulator
MIQEISTDLKDEGGAAILPPGEIFCPVGRALDIIGDRWTLALVRHLLDGPRGFQELRVRSGIAPRVLSSRLRSLVARGYVERCGEGGRPSYQLTERGRSLEPVIASIGRWYLRHGLSHLQANPRRFSATSAQSILESLPYMLREERAKDVDLTFEVRLTGPGGGVWSVHIKEGACTVRRGFAERADVRYTAAARAWCAVALGHVDARELYRQGRMTKDGGHEALDYFFYQIHRGGAAEPAAVARRLGAGTGSRNRSKKPQRRAG